MVEFLKRYGWFVVIAVLFNLLAYEYWSSYLASNTLFDAKHELTFSGEASYGHLAATTAGAVIFNSYFLYVLVRFVRKKYP